MNLDGAKRPGVDVVHNLEFCRSHRLPFEDGTFDEILVGHVLEHIRNVLPLMADLWRVAKPNAILTARVPYGSSDDAWGDQTHVRAYFMQSWLAFSQPYYHLAEYDYAADWQPEQIILVVSKAVMDDAGSLDVLNRRVRHERNIVQEMACRLRKVDPPRQRLKELQVSPILNVQQVLP